MKIAIITHVFHKQLNSTYFAYGPYVKEMNSWEKFCDEFLLVAPLSAQKITAIESAYQSKIVFLEVAPILFTSFFSSLRSLFLLPKIFVTIYKAMQQADHIHLRCPGNVGLLACFVQILFPNKPKTAKYAGNWDPKSQQPWSYRLQKWILNNTFLTRNIQVLVYGKWEKISKNIHPFFTASYFETEKMALQNTTLKNTIRIVFAGSLVAGKNPMYAMLLVQQLLKEGILVTLDIYGDGVQRQELEEFIKVNNLQKVLFLHGNQNQQTLKKAFQNSHFVILPSKSEGWPKAIAEGMFWGCVPIATPVSCVPYMLNYGKHGILLANDLIVDAQAIISLLQNEGKYFLMREKAANWSRKYTFDFFETEIKKMLLG